jgi:hypothetical protein
MYIYTENVCVEKIRIQNDANVRLGQDLSKNFIYIQKTCVTKKLESRMLPGSIFYSH